MSVQGSVVAGTAAIAPIQAWVPNPATERQWRSLATRNGDSDALESGDSAEGPSSPDLPDAGSPDLPDGRALEFEEILGRAGGQGTVYSLKNRPNLVYKRYKQDLVGAAESFDHLIAVGRWLPPALERVGIATVWPLAWCGPGDRVEGYVMPRIPEDYRVLVRTPYGEDLKEATLDRALAVSPDSAFHPVRQITAEERLQLVKLAGIFLDALHRNDLVYGDLSLKNLLFALDPVRLLVMDLDGVHSITTPLIPAKDILHTPDWHDPHAPEQLPRGFDLDRYRYALLVFRMLIANSPSGRLPQDPAALGLPSIKGLSSEQCANLQLLLRRVAASAGCQRPPISEWLTALGHGTG